MSFKSAFSLSSFTFIKRLFSPLLFCHNGGVSAYLRLLIFLLEILIPACASSSLAFHMMYIDLVYFFLQNHTLWKALGQFSKEEFAGHFGGGTQEEAINLSWSPRSDIVTDIWEGASPLTPLFCVQIFPKAHPFQPTEDPGLPREAWHQTHREHNTEMEFSIDLHMSFFFAGSYQPFDLLDLSD